MIDPFSDLLYSMRMLLRKNGAVQRTNTLCKVRGATSLDLFVAYDPKWRDSSVSPEQILAFIMGDIREFLELDNGCPRCGPIRPRVEMNYQDRSYKAQEKYARRRGALAILKVDSEKLELIDTKTWIRTEFENYAPEGIHFGDNEPIHYPWQYRIFG